MHWQEAVAKSPVRVAVRYTQREGERVTWRRYADGTADYLFRGRVNEARPQDVEGFNDWEPDQTP